MQIDMIGLGRMGSNMVRRPLQRGHECVAYNGSGESRQGSLERRCQRALALLEEICLMKENIAHDGGRGRQHDQPALSMNNIYQHADNYVRSCS